MTRSLVLRTTQVGLVWVTCVCVGLLVEPMDVSKVSLGRQGRPSRTPHLAPDEGRLAYSNLKLNHLIITSA